MSLEELKAAAVAMLDRAYCPYSHIPVGADQECSDGTEFTGSSIENDFRSAPMHPMVEAYKSYQQMPYDRPTWDLTSVLYSVEGPSYFNVSPAGNLNVTDLGATEFTPDAAGNRYYLTVDSIQAENIKQHFVQLLTKQPAHFNK